MLVLEDVHLLSSPGSDAVVHVLVDHLPRGSQLVLVGRRRSQFHLGAASQRSHGLFELDAADLALRDDEAEAMLSDCGVAPLARSDHRTHGACGGVAGGLVPRHPLATLETMSDPPPPSGEFSSTNRFIEEYLRDEVLQGLPDHLLEFLRSTSVLERMSGPLCDAVLDQAGSAGMLEDLAESNVMVFRLDGHDEWYRLHQLLRGMLSDDLRRRDPELHSALHLRASVWWEERDEYDAAVRHAIAGGDRSRARDLIWKAIPSFAAGDQPSTLSRWLESFDHSALIGDSTLALAVAGCRLANGDPAEVEWWITVARESDGSEYLPSGERRDAILALFDAMVGKDGLHAMREQAELACRLLPMSSPFHFLACMHEAWALHLEGDRSDALSKWDALVRMGPAPLPQGEAAGEAFFALAAIDDGNWVDAEARIERARAIVREHPIVEEKPAQVLVLAVSALWRAHASSDATVDLNRARELLSRLSGFERWAAVVIRCALARASILLGDLAPARDSQRRSRRAGGRNARLGGIAPACRVCPNLARLCDRGGVDGLVDVCGAAGAAGAA